MLANTIPYMPVGVHLAVVDPGVGSRRRPLALRDTEGRFYVGPDNGLLLPACERAGIEDARELANPAYALEQISWTFHGRDLFAPAAAHLANGRPARGARPADRARLARPARAARARDRRDGEIEATSLYVDSFGNIALNLTRDDVERIGIVPGTRVELDLAGAAVLRRCGPDVRRRATRRRDPLRGQLPEHVDRDLERQRGSDAPCAPGTADPHPPAWRRARRCVRVEPPGETFATRSHRSGRLSSFTGVARAGLEPATPRFSAVCATTELPRRGRQW